VKYRLSAAAERDLRGILLASLRTFGPAQAERYYGELLAAFKFITEFPESARERADLRTRARFHHLASHVIVYRITGGEVVVVRVLHGRQDIPRRIR
jgi:toxin ParE1/3/4